MYSVTWLDEWYVRIDTVTFSMCSYSVYSIKYISHIECIVSNMYTYLHFCMHVNLWHERAKERFNMINEWHNLGSTSYRPMIRTVERSTSYYFRDVEHFYWYDSFTLPVLWLQNYCMQSLFLYSYGCKIIAQK